jgi:hypothetical protein
MAVFCNTKTIVFAIPSYPNKELVVAVSQGKGYWEKYLI